MKEKLVDTKHPQSRQIQDRHNDVLRRYIGPCYSTLSLDGIVPRLRYLSILYTS